MLPQAPSFREVHVRPQEPSAAGGANQPVPPPLTVRKLQPLTAGPVEGDEPSAVLSRVEADLANGDFPAALAEWQFLPAESRQAAAGWAGKLEKRVAADKALRGITAMATK